MSSGIGFVVTTALILLRANDVEALQPGGNSSACMAAPTDCSNVCSTVPNPANKNPAANPLCYQGAPNATNNDYNDDPANPVDSIPTCETCAFYNYSYYVRNDPIYTQMELWSPANPLCLLKNATNIQELVASGAMQGWECDDNHQASTSYCSGGWTGVQCNNQAGQNLAPPYNETIRELRLPGIGLTGAIDGVMDLLEFLVDLDLSFNSLHGAVPETLGSPTYLQTLKLNSNMFTGALPRELNVLTSLVEFNISDNNVRYQLPEEYGGLTALQSLDLASNAFEGSVPRELCQITGLAYLNFEKNNELHCYDDCLTSVAQLLTGGIPKCSEVDTSSFHEELTDRGHGSSMVIGISGSGEFQYAATPKETLDRVNSTYPVLLSSNYGKDFANAAVSEASPWTSLAISAYGYAYGANGDGVYMTSNDGVSWTLSMASTYDFDLSTTYSGEYVLAVTADGETDGAVYVNNAYGAPASWVQVNVPGKVNTASVSKTGEVMAAMDKGSKNSLWVSRNYGVQDSWLPFGDVLPAGVSCNDLQVGGSGERMYLADCVQQQGTESVNIEAILMSDDYGKTWYNSKAPLVSWKHLAANFDGGNVIWATSEAGLYYSGSYGNSGSYVLADAATGWEEVETIASGETALVTRVGDGQDGVYLGSWGTTTSSSASVSSSAAATTVRRSLRSPAMSAMSADFSKEPEARFTNTAIIQRSSGAINPRTGTGTATAASALIPMSDEYVWKESGFPAAYTGVAVSDDSVNMVAVANSASGGVYISSNGGDLWTNTFTGGNFECVASSGTGQYVYASVAQTDSLQPYVTRSTEYGKEWLSTSGIPRNLSNPVVGLATSSSGQYVTAITSYEPIYYSTDYGVTFTASENTPVDTTLFGDMGTYQNGAVAVSSTGEIQVVASTTAGVGISTDYGANWTSVAVNGAVGLSSAAISANGQIIAVASPYGNGSFFVSVDAGVTFAAGTSLGVTDLVGLFISMSSDGSSLVAVTNPGYVYISMDQAVTWTQIFNEFVVDFGSVATSASLDTILSAVSDGSQNALWLGTLPAPTSMPSVAPPVSANGDDDDLSTGEVAGIAVGSTLGAVAIAVAVFYFCYKNSAGESASLLKSDLITGAELRKSQH